MAKQKLPTRVRAWEKTGRALLNEYLDTLAPDIREWLDEEGITEWPEQEEEWHWAEDIETHENMARFGQLIRAFGYRDCVLDAEKLAYLITDRWKTPDKVPKR